MAAHIEASVIPYSITAGKYASMRCLLRWLDDAMFRYF